MSKIKSNRLLDCVGSQATAISILAGTLIQYLITGPDPVYYRWYLFPEVRHGVRATRHRRD